MNVISIVQLVYTFFVIIVDNFEVNIDDIFWTYHNNNKQITVTDSYHIICFFHSY